MLTLPPSVRIFLCVDPVDMRGGIDSLIGVARERPRADPFSGAMFVFTGRDRRRVKFLFFDRGGFVLVMKRMESGRFHWPDPAPGSDSIDLYATQLSMLLEGLDFQAVVARAHWTPKNSSRGGCSSK